MQSLYPALSCDFPPLQILHRARHYYTMRLLLFDYWLDVSLTIGQAFKLFFVVVVLFGLYVNLLKYAT